MFAEFWNQYPRKVGKRRAAKLWAKLSQEEQREAMEALPAYIAHVEASDFLQYRHGDTWLSKFSWEDDWSVPEQKQKAAQWWATDAGVLAEGQRRGLEPRPGESMQQFRGRVNGASPVQVAA